MANASLILEIALLLLVAFLVGCTLGWLARKLTQHRRAPAAIEAPAPAPEEAAAAPLVAAPQVSPLFQRAPGPTPAQRLDAASGKSRVQPAPAQKQVEPSPEQSPLSRPERLPARVAGEVSTPKPTTAEPDAAPAVEPPPPPEDPEAAARQAVEGGWTPPRRRSPTPFPEASATPELPSDAPTAEAADAAMAGARSAVAAALAAADVVLAEAPAAEPQSEQPPQPPRPARSRRRFGAPPLLDAPRDGDKDNLTAIRGITPTLADALNGLGVFHYDQVAGWDGKAVVWVDGQLGLRGRIAREKWPEQARRLAVRPVRARR